MRTICFKIDGREATAPEGTTILEAAKSVGIDIPHLCYDSRLEPAGMCRLCVVQIEGRPGLTISCNTRVAEGMEICTENNEIAAIRKTVLELILSEHRVACTSCDKDGACKFQDCAYFYQADEGRFGLPGRRAARQNYATNSEGILYDRDKCILCGLCVRYCEEVQKAEALTFWGRLEQMEVGTAFGIDLQESSCVLCGGCVEICPAGAMLDRAAIGKGREKDMTRTRTTCAYCGVGCQLDLNVNAKTNEIVRVTSEVGCIPNNGNLCVKGRFGMDFVKSDKRLTEPLIKKKRRGRRL
jgi:predicted molibdopterin-dependent oxidoreductase YjgC